MRLRMRPTPDSSEIVSEAELQMVFSGTNFGTSKHRHLLHQAVLKTVCGYHCGHTITTITRELELIGVSGLPTKKGRKLMSITFHEQIVEGP